MQAIKHNGGKKEFRLFPSEPSYSVITTLYWNLGGGTDQSFLAVANLYLAILTNKHAIEGKNIYKFDYFSEFSYSVIPTL